MKASEKHKILEVEAKFSNIN